MILCMIQSNYWLLKKRGFPSQTCEYMDVSIPEDLSTYSACEMHLIDCPVKVNDNDVYVVI